MCILSRTDVRFADDYNEACKACKAKMRRQNHSNFFTQSDPGSEISSTKYARKYNENQGGLSQDQDFSKRYELRSSISEESDRCCLL